MGFFSFLALAVIIYLLWRILDQQPDALFRLSEIQRDIAEIRRHIQKLEASEAAAPQATASATPPAETAARDDAPAVAAAPATPAAEAPSGPRSGSATPL